MQVYRDRFQPSEQSAKPRFMLAVNVFAADTTDEAHYLRSTMQLAFARLRSGMPGKLPRPTRDIDAEIPPALRRMVDESLRVSAIGTRDEVRDQLAALIARYRPDELILTGQIHDHAARLRSFELAAEAMATLPAEEARGAAF